MAGGEVPQKFKVDQPQSEDVHFVVVHLLAPLSGHKSMMLVVAMVVLKS